MTNQTARPVDTRVPRARSLRTAMTDAERKMWQRLRQSPFKEHHFRRQATIGRYFCDFASHKLRLVIEVDGGQHAESKSDQVRTRFLNARGYRVLRFWNNDVLGNIDGTLEAIIEAIGDAPTPNPSPPLCGGRGTRARASLELPSPAVLHSF